LGHDCQECHHKRPTLQRYSLTRPEPSKLARSLAEPFKSTPPRGSERVQTKLALSQPEDRSEQEADRIAEQVTGLSQTQPTGQSAPADEAPISAEAAQTPGPIATPETAAADESAAAGLVVEDEARQLAPGQMRRSEFLDELRTAVCAAADAELAAVGRSTEGCPYIERWIGYYRTQSSQHIERAIRRYAPGTAGMTAARDYIPMLAEQVRRAVAVWATTGEITGVPEGVSPEAPGAGAGGAPAAAGNILFKGHDGGAREASDPQAIQAQLGSGHPLDSGVKSRMETAFGHDFSRVRVHADAESARLAASLNARAFTIGPEIAFEAGEYQPGTLVGDALLAHELAHVVQQGGAVSSAGPLPEGGTEYNGLEEDADNSAVGVVASLWGGAKGMLANISKNAMPSLRSGLSLQRCPKKKETCAEGDKSISVDLVKLRGSGRTPATDLAEANKIYKKCCVQFTTGQDKTVPNDKSDAWLGGDTELKWGDTCGGVDAEEKAMFNGATSEYTLSSRMRIFYVATINPTTALGYSTPPYCAVGDEAPYINHAVIPDVALSDTLAHELGHILLNSGKHEGIDNPSDKNNLMFSPGRTASDLDDSQCKIIYNNA